jgi:hypothetical protein
MLVGLPRGTRSSAHASSLSKTCSPRPTCRSSSRRKRATPDAYCAVLSPFQGTVYVRNAGNRGYITGTANIPLPAFTGRPGEPRHWGAQFTLRR